MTIKDLAALSGYSLGTVSRVLNNQPHVSEKAREQIMAIVKEQGFELNTNDRNLKQTHSNNILVIVRGTHNELFAALVERLQTVATGGEYQLVVDYIGELDDEVRRAVKRVREVKPGLPYTPPPAQEKLDPLSPERDEAALSRARRAGA